MRNRRSAIFLTELLAAILIFAVAAGVSIRIFAFARTRADDSRDLGRAVLAAESAAERWRAGDDTADARYFDRDWEPCAESGAAYTLTLAASGQTAEIRVSGGGETIYTLSVRRTGGGS